MSKQKVTVNAEQRLYVISLPECGGFSCLGFDVADRRAKDLLAWSAQYTDDVPEFNSHLTGTIEGYEQYKKAERIALDVRIVRGGIVPTELTAELIPYEGKRVEVVNRWGAKSRFWVGRSTGPIPVHLEIKQRNSSGGMPVTGAPFQSIRQVA
jgi:hypothetical protein